VLHSFFQERFLPSMRAMSVAFVYEDIDTHTQAEAAYGLLIQEADEEGRLNASWWRTSVLGDPKLCRVAARAISGADLIVLSVHAERSPSSWLMAWIESWPLESGRPVGLVALLNGLDDSAGRSDWDQYLREFASRKGVLYLPGIMSVEQEIRPGRFGGAESGSNRVIEPYQHWGLNE
jgi:hypothetical protein